MAQKRLRRLWARAANRGITGVKKARVVRCCESKDVESCQEALGKDQSASKESGSRLIITGIERIQTIAQDKTVVGRMVALRSWVNFCCEDKQECRSQND